MKHLRKFNENALGSWKFSDIRKLYAKSQGLGGSGKEVASDSEYRPFYPEADPNNTTEKLMKVLKPYFDEHGLDGTKEYLANILDNFDFDDFIEYHYGKK